MPITTAKYEALSTDEKKKYLTNEIKAYEGKLMKRYRTVQDMTVNAITTDEAIKAMKKYRKRIDKYKKRLAAL